MVSGRASKRAKGNASNTDSVKHVQIAYFPKYFWLFEHDQRHTVIRVPSAQDLIEIEEMMRRGNALCNHPDKLGACIHIESATFNEWLDTHPGDAYDTRE
jgi:hypothetical protein